jgi:diaminopropionate ammonia-lyase
MPKGSAQERLQNILKENADATITDMNYDGCVHLADKNATNTLGAHADTAFEDIEQIRHGSFRAI